MHTQVQEIYRNTDFDGDGRPDNIIPSIARIQVLNQNDPGYRFSASTINVNTFLDLWSQQDHTEFCLALLLTYRDFANGVLGLAWVAEPAGGNRGGICEGRVRLQVGERSLNTAIVTYLNYGQRQPRPVTVITITHQLGHNFGSHVSLSPPFLLFLAPSPLFHLPPLSIPPPPPHYLQSYHPIGRPFHCYMLSRSTQWELHHVSTGDRRAAAKQPNVLTM